MVRAVFGLSALVMALIVVGCDGAGSQRRKMEGKQAPNWPALQAMKDQGGLMMVGMSMEKQGPKAAKQAAAAPAFKQLVDNLEKEAIPSSFATSARETAKKDLVESLRKIAEAGSDDEIKKLWEKAQASMKTLSEP